MGRGFTVFIYVFAIAVLAAAILLDANMMARLLAVEEMPVTAVVEIDAMRLLFGLASSVILLAALIWTFGHSYLFTKQIRDGYRSWASPVYGLPKRERFWTWRWLIGLWVLVAFIVIARTSSSHSGVASLFDSLMLQSGLMGTVEFLVLSIAGVLLARQAWTDVRAGIAPLGVVGVLFGVFLLVAAGEAIGWGALWLDSGVHKVAETRLLHTDGGIVTYGTIWLQRAPALILFFYLGFWPALGYVFPQIHFILDRMALPIAPAGLFPIALVGSCMDDYAAFDGIWNRAGWPMADGMALVLSVGLLMMVMFMRRYRGSVNDASGSLTFPGSSRSHLR